MLAAMVLVACVGCAPFLSSDGPSGVPLLDVDHGTLVLERGNPPADVSRADATRTFLDTAAAPPASATPTHQVLSGVVTMKPGLGAPALDHQPAWVFVYQVSLPVACPSMDPATTTTPHPAGTRVFIVTAPGVMGDTDYEGIGTGLCEPRATPSASNGAALKFAGLG